MPRPSFTRSAPAAWGRMPKPWSIPNCASRGSDGLRIADASVMPTLVSGNTNAPAIMIGVRAADFIAHEA